MKGLFITGTDTGVGKTVGSAAIFQRYRKSRPLRYWKPIQTGIEQDDDSAEFRRLTGCLDSEWCDCGIRLERPVSPHLAAKWAGQRIDLGALIQSTPGDGAVRWIVEGAGGVLVPINESETMADWIVRLELPVVVAARTALGTINHTLLTLEALRARAVPVAAVFMIGEPNADNREAIEHYGEVRVIGEMPRFHRLDCESLSQWSTKHLDPDGFLEEFLK